MADKPTYDELAAHVERLREALNNALTHCIDNDVNTDRFNQMISEALEETPSQSLNHIKAQVEEETIERSITVLRKHYRGGGGHSDPINALKYQERKYRERSNED